MAANAQPTDSSGNHLIARPRLCIVSTIATPLRVFMGPHILALSETYDVTLVCDGERSEVEPLLNERVSFVACPIRRDISLAQDIRCTVWLRQFLRAGRFDVIHTLMPKSGLLGMIAGRLAGTPMRFHTFTGQVWATRSGPMRTLLKSMDRVLSACATRLLTDSQSQMRYLVDERIVSSGRIEVLADGSICGVDIERFRRDPAVRTRLRAELGVPDGGTLFIFLGRLTVEKGIVELLSAFREVAAAKPNAHLAIVGPMEADFEQDLADTASKTGGRLHRIGFTHTPQHYMSAADVFCLPSYREGFGTVIIEAAAAGLPTIASRIYGVTDAIEDGRTGLLHTVRDVAQMRDLMLRLIDDPALRDQLGEAAYERAVTRFPKQRLVQAMLDYYTRERIKA